MSSPVCEPEHSKFLFAARRMYNLDGTTAIFLVAPKTGERFCVNEKMLWEEKDIKLGDFVFARSVNGGSLLVSSIRKTQHKKKLTVEVEGNVAYIKGVRGEVIPAKGQMAFKSEDFANALVEDELQRGECTARISLLEQPLTVSPSITFIFQATNLIPCQSEEVVVGEGFSEDPRTSPVVGAGFAETGSRNPTLTAVVLDVSERKGIRMNFLWILDKNAEGLMIDAAHPCKKGHFFEGTFKEKNGRWKCAKYGKPVDTLIPGGLENDKIYFKVEVTSYHSPRGNERFSWITARYFEKILDNESNLSKNCVGQHVKIQNRAIGENNFAWVVVEVL